MDAQPLWSGPVDHERLRLRLAGAGFTYGTSHGAEERRKTLAGDRGEGRSVPGGETVGVGHVEAAADHHPGPVEEVRLVLVELAEQDPQLFLRLLDGASGQID